MFLRSVDVEITVLSSGFRIGTSLAVADTWRFSLYALGFVGWLWGEGWTLTLTYLWCWHPGCLAISLGHPNSHLLRQFPLRFYLFVTFLLTDIPASIVVGLHLPHKCGKLPYCEGSRMALWATFPHFLCISKLQSDLAYYRGTFLSAGCSLHVPGGDCLFSINLNLFLMGLRIRACASH